MNRFIDPSNFMNGLCSQCHNSAERQDVFVSFPFGITSLSNATGTNGIRALVFTVAMRRFLFYWRVQDKIMNLSAFVMIHSDIKIEATFALLDI